MSTNERQETFDSAIQLTEQAASGLFTEAYSALQASSAESTAARSVPEGFPAFFISTDMPAQLQPAPSGSDQPAPGRDRPATAQPAPTGERPAPVQPAPSGDRPVPVQPAPAGERPAPAPGGLQPERADGQDPPPEPNKIPGQPNNIQEERIRDAVRLLVENKGEIPDADRPRLQSLLEGAYLKDGLPGLQRVIGQINQKMGNSGLSLGYIGIPNGGNTDLFVFPTSETPRQFGVYPVGRIQPNK